jgi:DNA/RNA endonuclease YhcR with UshA esterase domain
MRIKSLNVLAGLILSSVPALPHHSFAAEYDANKPVTVTGTVTQVEWMNPHARFYINVKDDMGIVTNWELELGSPNGLMRAGWTRNSLKKGDVVTVTGSLAKDGTKLVNARTVTLADGTQVLGASSQGGEGK